MRLRIVLLLMTALVAWKPTPARAATTPTEAAAIAAASQDHTAYTLPPAQLAQSQALSRTSILLHFGGALWSILVLALLLELRIAATLRDWATTHIRNPWTQGFCFLLFILLATTALSLPLDLYAQHIERVYGLSVQGWPSWFADLAKSFVLTYLLASMGLMVLFFLIRRFPRRWWLWLWFPTMAATVLGVFLTPYVIDPLFNTFEPLSQTNPALVEQLERVVARGNDTAGGSGIAIPPDRMFLMKASAKVTGLNAYVTGFGSSKRVVVWDTTIAHATPDEILFIFGHEMGHYVLGHILRGILVSFVLILAGFWIGFHLAQALLRRFGARWRIPSQQDWAALVVYVLVVSVLGFLGEPLGNAVSRAQEHAADVYGQEVVHGIVADPQATGQAAFNLIGSASLSNPNPSPLRVFWSGTHPPTWFRAAFAKHYDPWSPEAAPKYFKK